MIVSEMSGPPVAIEGWTPAEPRWQDLVDLIAGEGQTEWAFDPYLTRFPRHFLVALQEGKVVGFLMFVHWDIGPHDRGTPTLELGGTPLTEAKIIAFGVAKRYRRQGIGRALQERALQRAKELGCYQVRSVSELPYHENHSLKLSMGFAVEPMERDSPCFAFIMPLR